MRSPLLAITISAVLLATSGPALSKSTSVLKQAIVPDMLGTDLAYFEKIAGPARMTFSAEEKSYRFGNCDVSVGFAQGKVQWFEVEAVPACTVDIHAFIHNYSGKRVQIHHMTVGHFEEIAGGHGSYLADCLEGCGNAADPIAYQHWEGSRADDFIEVRTSVVLAGASSLTASGKWEDAMRRRETEEWVEKARFNCAGGERYFAAARDSFKDVKISTIAVGHGIPLPKCGG